MPTQTRATVGSSVPAGFTRIRQTAAAPSTACSSRGHER
jgi:hypothetical protein